MNIRLAAALALAGAVITSACSDSAGLTEPITAPSYSSHTIHSITKTRTGGTTTSPTAGTTSTTSTTNTAGLEGDQAGPKGLLEDGLKWSTTEVSVVIDSEGGTLVLLSAPNRDEDEDERTPYHSLTVPPGAVKRPTRFTMRLDPGADIAVHLTAEDVRSKRPVTEFDQPLTLRLTHAGSLLMEDTSLSIVYILDGMIVETVASRWHEEREFVVGQIWHFSRYAVAWE